MLHWLYLLLAIFIVFFLVMYRRRARRNLLRERVKEPHFPIRNLATQECYLDTLPVRGHIPEWLHGSLVRNGPARFCIGGHCVNHWFDGLAMLHCFIMRKGQVSYASKYLRTSAYDTMMERSSLKYGRFSDPCSSRFRRLFTRFLRSKPEVSAPNANVNVSQIADEYVAMTETPLPIRFDPETARTLGPLQYQDALPQSDVWESAHPVNDRRRQEYINYYIDFGRESHYQIYKVADGSRTRKVFASIPVQYPSYMHSFAVTDEYVVLVEYPLRVNPLKLLAGAKGFIDEYRWHAKEPTRFLVIKRSTGDLEQILETEAFFCFHHINAFQRSETELTLDMVTYPDAQVVYGTPEPSQLSSICRFELDLKNQSIQRHDIVSGHYEMPRINDSSASMNEYNFVYLVDFLPERAGGKGSPITKLDINTGEQTSWSQVGCTPGEPVFVPAPDAQTEDEGVVMSVVMDRDESSSFLLVLDAASFEELGRAGVPHPVPYGIHGNFFQH